VSIIRTAHRRPRYADVAATLALIIAMGGTAYAADALPRNSVGTPQLKAQAVTNPKIGTDAVSQFKIQDGSISTAKIQRGAVTGQRLAKGAVTSAKLARGAVTVASLGGSETAGPISVNLAGHTCGTLDFGVSGARAGQAAFLTFTGAVPKNVMFGPMRVISPKRIVEQACDVSAHAVAANHIGVRVVTLP
jgi:hypothetical protein